MFKPSLRWLILTLVSAFAACIGHAGADEPTVPAADGKPLEYWIEQLDSDQFLQRQTASQRLLSFGDGAVEPLAKVATRGQLELTERAISVLQSLAIKQSPDDESGAYGALSQLVEQGGGSASLRARSSMEVIRREREQQAIEKLVSAGVKLGYREFVIDSRSLNENLVWIDSSWNGDVEALRWLKWISGVAYGVVQGTAVNHDVIEYLVRMPDLRTVVIREAKLDSDIFTPLSKMQRIDELEFRYVPLNAIDAEKIAALPIRVQLGLMGTNLPLDSARMLREAMPGLNIVYKQGGFLGVKCNNFSPVCQIDSLVEGGAAQKAGLEPGDVIERIDGAPIARFEDLQIQIGSHLPDDEIEIEYDRRGEKAKVKLKLMRMATE